MSPAAEAFGILAGIAAVTLITALVVDIVRGADKPIPAPEFTHAESEARATALAGRLMDCYGTLGSYKCRPTGPVAQGDTTELLHPVVACWDGQCLLVTP